MPAIIPHRFLVRIAHACPYVKGLPKNLVIPDSGIINNYRDLDGGENFAELRLGWNEFGLGLQFNVEGKKKDPEGDADKPRTSDGLTLWIDTRDARTSHRASRFCHQFHFIPIGGGSDKDDPAFVQTAINRASQDAPTANASEVIFKCERSKKGYTFNAYIPATALSGFDPEQYPRWGFYYHVRDSELGDQYLSVNSEFPFSDDPSLWEVLELAK